MRLCASSIADRLFPAHAAGGEPIVSISFKTTAKTTTKTV